MSRLRKKFAELKQRREKALIVFMTAGDPSLKKNAQLVPAFEKEGADIIELGVPFSDPLADGPVIQASSQRSLARGTNLKKILKLVADVRRTSEVPLVLMSYLNPLWHHGLERFGVEARKAGVDGVIVPDLPPDEGRGVAAAMKRHGIDLIYLLAPTSTEKRLKEIARRSRGFVYYVSMTGVTGMKKKLSDGLAGRVKAVKRVSPVPVCVGFGVSTPDEARSAAFFADGVIIGSVVVRGLDDNKKLNAARSAKKLIRPFAKALGKRTG